DQRDAVPRRQDEAIAKPLLGMADVPARDTGEQRRDEQVDLGARAARVAALAVVQLDVDELVDDVLDLFPLRELLLELRVALIDDGRCNRHLYLLVPRVARF